MMPRLNGVETCEEIRKDPTFNDVVILFLSARNEEFTQVACYDAGADDFIEKPIKIKLIIKKIEILLKKSKYGIKAVNGVILNDKNYTVSSDGETHSLTKKQFNLLQLLMSKPDTVFKKRKDYAICLGRYLCKWKKFRCANNDNKKKDWSRKNNYNKRCWIFIF